MGGAVCRRLSGLPRESRSLTQGWKLLPWWRWWGYNELGCGLHGALSMWSYLYRPDVAGRAHLGRWPGGGSVSGSSQYCSIQSLQTGNSVFPTSTFQGLETPAESGARHILNAHARPAEGRLVPAWLCSSGCCFVKVFCDGSTHCLSPS